VKRGRKIGLWLPVLLAAVLISVGASQSESVVFEVTSTGDEGDSDIFDGVCDDGMGGCTLRAAIEQANAHENYPGVPDSVLFDIAGSGPHMILPQSPLPAVTDYVCIDGFSQPGASPNTNSPDQGSNASLMIVISGGGMQANGLELHTGGCLVRGLAINDFERDEWPSWPDTIYGGGGVAIEVDLSGRPGPEDPNRIEGCVLGSDVYGYGLGNAHGLRIRFAWPVVVGSESGDPASMNVISHNTETGVWVAEASSDVTVDGNVVSFNGETGVLVTTGVQWITLAGNVISNNGHSGVEVVADDYYEGPYVWVWGNSIHTNGALGIDIIGPFPSGVNPNDPGDSDVGPNDGQNYPELYSPLVGAAGTEVAGALHSEPTSDYRLEFFSNPLCDESGHGEGMNFLGSWDITTDASGDASFEADLPFVITVGEFVTATATTLNGTSEFSACVESEGASTISNSSWGVIKALYR